MKTTGNTVVITGGSSGIGLAAARAFVAGGNTVIAIARSKDKLERAQAEVPGLIGAVGDVADERSFRPVMERLCAEHPGFNVLLNAAGISRGYDFATAPDALEIARAEINTNLMGTLIATRLALPKLLTQPEAAVITISSGIALAPHLREPTHSATKAALHAFCRCLRAQLEATPVRVIEVMPPLTDTPNTTSYKAKKAAPDEIAAAIVSGLARGTPEVRIGIVKALAFLSRAAPGFAASVVTNSGT